jgi:hypothetical protein
MVLLTRTLLRVNAIRLEWNLQSEAPYSCAYMMSKSHRELYLRMPIWRISPAALATLSARPRSRQ